METQAQRDARDGDAEFRDHAVAVAPFVGVLEAGGREHLDGGEQILHRDVAAMLRLVQQRTFEHHLRVQQCPERLWVFGLHELVPAFHNEKRRQRGAVQSAHAAPCSLRGT